MQSALSNLQHGTSPDARAARAALRANRRATEIEHSCLGSEMGQRYVSRAVCLSGVSGAPPAPANPKLEYIPSSYPGTRLPHAWVSTDRQKEISTHDLAGHGAFALFTGVGGTERWSAAAEEVMRALKQRTGGPGVVIKVFTIGLGQEYEDVYWMWYDKCGVAEAGAVLARPDRFVGWRCEDVEGRDVGKELEGAMLQILGYA